MVAAPAEIILAGRAPAVTMFPDVTIRGAAAVAPLITVRGPETYVGEATERGVVVTPVAEEMTLAWRAPATCVVGNAVVTGAPAVTVFATVAPAVIVCVLMTGAAERTLDADSMVVAGLVAPAYTVDAWLVVPVYAVGACITLAAEG